MLGIVPLGKVVVATAGVPVKLGAGLADLFISRLFVSVIAGLTGKCYLGDATLDVSTGAGVIKEFWPNSAGGVDDSYQLPACGSKKYRLQDFWIDVAVSGEGLYVSAVVDPD